MRGRRRREILSWGSRSHSCLRVWPFLGAAPAAPAPASSGSLGAQREGTWDFRAVVAVRDAAAAEAPPGGGALAALAGYGDSDDDDE